MPQIVTTASDLGTGSDGEMKGVRLPNGHVELLTWNSAGQAWVGKPRASLRLLGPIGFNPQGGNDWKYPGAFVELVSRHPEQLHPTDWGHQIHMVENGGLFWAAGLRLQEHLSGQMEVVLDEGFDLPEIALAWYPLANLDSFLSPASFNHGVKLTTGNKTIDSVFHYYSTGWQPTVLPTPPASDEHLYPEIYQRGAGSNWRHISAEYRWVYGAGADDAGSPPADTYPFPYMLGWYEANDLQQADGTGVATWPDKSGWGLHFKQATSGNQPLVQTSGGIRYLSFDGTNDFMETPLRNSYSGPYTLFLVLRQRAGGGTQQMWFQNANGNGPVMIYKDTATLHVWGGSGGDMIVTPSAYGNWKVYSIQVNGAGSNIWENTTPLANTGDANTGTAGFLGYRIGTNGAFTLPASIDVAEVRSSWGRVMGDPERTAVVNTLRAKYSI